MKYLQCKTSRAFKQNSQSERLEIGKEGKRYEERQEKSDKYSDERKQIQKKCSFFKAQTQLL